MTLEKSDLPDGLSLWDGRGSYGQVVAIDPARCAAQVMDHNDRWPHFYQCRNRIKYDERGHGWCGMHRPSAVQAKNEKSEAKYQKGRRADRLRGDMDDARRAIVDVARKVFRQQASMDDLDAAVTAYEELDRQAKEGESK